MRLLSVSRSQIVLGPTESCRAAFILHLPRKGKTCFPGPSALSRGPATGDGYVATPSLPRTLLYDILSKFASEAEKLR
jgi:hypothetical protein